MLSSSRELGTPLCGEYIRNHAVCILDTIIRVTVYAMQVTFDIAITTFLKFLFIFLKPFSVKFMQCYVSYHSTLDTKDFHQKNVNIDNFQL